MHNFRLCCKLNKYFFMIFLYIFYKIFISAPFYYYEIFTLWKMHDFTPLDLIFKDFSKCIKEFGILRPRSNAVFRIHPSESCCACNNTAQHEKKRLSPDCGLLLSYCIKKNTCMSFTLDDTFVTIILNPT